MTDDTEHLVLEILKRVQADTTALRRELGERMANLEVRMTAIEQQLAGLTTAVYAGHDRLNQIENRLGRVERRLELSE